jgi:hypothetical protein
MSKYQDPLVVDPANGVVRGDSKAMPDRGTSSGFVNVGNDHYGADVGENAINRMGSAHTAPDSAWDNVPPGEGRPSGGGHDRANPGRGMGSVTDSDPAAECYPDDQRA